MAKSPLAERPPRPGPKPLHAALQAIKPRAPRFLPTGLADLDALLPGGGFLLGAVTEIATPRGLAMSTSLALTFCAAAQAEARSRQQEGWCAFLDPTRSLHAPGVEAQGVDLERLLVVRPPHEALSRVAVRVAGSRAFSVVVVDAGGLPGANLPGSLRPWAAVVRRLVLAIEGSHTAVILLTHRESPRPLPLPVATRLDVTQEAPGKLIFRIARHDLGNTTDWQATTYVPPEDRPSAPASEPTPRETEQRPVRPREDADESAIEAWPDPTRFP
jgi:recombination protein RecA